MNQSERHVQLALHAAGVRPNLATGGLCETEAIQELGGPAYGFLLGQAVDAAAENEVLGAGRHRVGAGLLRYVADREPDRLLLLDDIESGDSRSTGIRPGQGGQDLHCGRLTGAVGSEQTEYYALRDGEAEAVEGSDGRLLTGRRVGLDQVGHLDREVTATGPGVRGWCHGSNSSR